MIPTLHSVSVNHCNVVTQARIAKETGYQSLEFLYDKLLRYMEDMTMSVDAGIHTSIDALRQTISR